VQLAKMLGSYKRHVEPPSYIELDEVCVDLVRCCTDSMIFSITIGDFIVDTTGDNHTYVYMSPLEALVLCREDNKQAKLQLLPTSRSKFYVML